MTIVISTFRDAENLRRTLSSLCEIAKESSEGEIEIVISDGGSQDHTRDVVHEFSSIVDKFRSEQDRGVYDGMNLGMELATGRYVQFLNAGDRATSKDAYRLLLNHLDALKGSPLNWTIARALHEHGGQRPPSQIANIPHNWIRHAYGLQPHCHQATIFDLQFLKSMGGHRIDSGFAADHEVIMRIGAAGPPSEFDVVLVRYQGGGMSHLGRTHIPRLLHENRERVMQLGRSTSRIDSCLSRAVALRNRARTFVGSMKRLGR